MSTEKLTQAEAQRLLTMLKHSLVDAVSFPGSGKTNEFDVIGDTNKDIFTINIFRGKIQKYKCSMGARIKKNSILLLALHVNPTTVHINPDGERITGNHWHIYREGYGHSFAFPANSIEDEKFIENTISFLIKFSVVERPKMLYQYELY